MIPPTRRQAAIGVVATLLLLAGFGLALQRPVGGKVAGTAPGGGVEVQAGPALQAAGDEGTTGGGPALLVDVAGAVRRPGVYELPAGARVRDAIARAGGARANAQLAAVNRAARVVDGQQVLVPEGVAASAAGVPASGPGAGAVTGPVSINSADAAALDALEGIGPVTAQQIIDDRAANGPFATIAELDRVPGIGPATLAALEGKVQP